MNANSPSGPNPATPAGALHLISGEVADITRRMSAVSDQLAALQQRVAPTAQPPRSAAPTPPGVRQPPPQSARPPRPLTYPGTPNPILSGPQSYRPQQGAPQHRPPHVQWPTPAYQAAQHKPMSERIAAATEGGLIGKILAGVGVAITLIGVVLLLVLAAQAGLLRPEIRVAGGGVLAAILFAIGIWIGRNRHKRSGAAALVATGVAAALFDVLATTAIYHWLPSHAALIIAAVLAVGGLAVAHRWDSQALGLMVGIPLAALTPFLADGNTELLAGFLLTYAAATLWIQLGRNWTAMFATNTLVATLPLIYATLAVGEGDRRFFVIGVCANLVLAVGSAIALMRSANTPLIQALISTVAVLPMLGTVHVAGDVIGVSVLGCATIVLATLALVGGRIAKLSLPVRIVWLVAAAVTTTGAVGSTFDGSGLAVGIAGVAVVTAAAAVTTTDLRLPLRIIASVFTGVALLHTLGPGALGQLLFHALDTADRALLLIVVALTLTAVGMLTYSWAQPLAGPSLQTIWTLGCLIVLWLATNLCVGLGALISHGTDAGIRGGHAGATIVWVLAGTGGLLWARRQDYGARAVTLTVSLSIIAAAVTKLFLFDLAALDGVFRVIAFIVVGLLLLSLGVAYAQSLSKDEKKGDHPRDHAIAGT